MNLTQKPLDIGRLLYPELTLLDLIGPHTVCSWFASIRLVSKKLASSSSIEWQAK